MNHMENPRVFVILKVKKENTKKTESLYKNMNMMLSSVLGQFISTIYEHANLIPYYLISLIN